VRVLKKYGWAHSLHFSTDAEIVASHRSTPPDVPWFIHLAEGTDEIAAGEYQRLKALGCVGSNTVIIHGVGLTDEDIADAAPRVRGLVWCPTTNLYLLGKTPNLRMWLDAGGRIALGTDSRLTADGDFWNEMLPDDFGRLDSDTIDLIDDQPELVQYGNAAQILGVRDVGHLKVGARADWILMPSDLIRRAWTPLVVRGGEPQIGEPAVMAKFPHIETISARLDDKEKSINVRLARQIARCTLKERGLELLQDPFARRRWRVL
jgi:cytosine/adenosine deaminase-related metal-dependent hydrolase